MTSNNTYDLNDAINELNYILVGHPKTSARGLAVLCAIDALKHILNGDLVSVIHAKWIKDKTNQLYCSACGQYGVYSEKFGTLHTLCCPNCGAKMEETEDV